MINQTLNFSRDEIEHFLEQNDEAIRRHMAGIAHVADVIELLRQIDVNHWPRLIGLIDDSEVRAEVISGLDRGEWHRFLPMLSPEKIAEVIRELDTDDAADLLADVPLPKRLSALRLLSQTEQSQVQQLLRYPEDSAGGIMQLELALVDEEKTVNDAIKVVRQLVEDDVEVLSVLVVDKRNRLLGTLALVDLLINKDTTKVIDIMDPQVVSVKPLLDQEEVAAIFKKYDLLTLPVVDDKARVLGQIVFDDVIDVVQEEAEEDALHMAGTSAEELLHRSAIFAIAKVRLPWLGVALGCSLVSGFLLHHFEPTMEKAVIILSFVPVITAMGGNVGTQSATLLIRGFATGKVDLSNVSWFLVKELRVAILMGSIYGLCAGLVGTFVLSNGNPYLGIVVFLSMICGMMTAALLGVLAPSLLKRLGIDPAIASGPFVTTMNDITGILIYMLIANLFIVQLSAG